MKYALFDMSARSTSFSFLVFCIIAKSRCAAMGEECRIVFKKGPNQGFQTVSSSAYSIEEKKFRMPHMLYPTCTLMGLDYSTDVFSDMGESCISPQETCGLEAILTQAKTGAPLFWPQPSERAMEIVRNEFPENPFVITLRETNGEDRNSDIVEWIKFANYASKNSNVVFVRDTDKCGETLEQFNTFSLASIDLDIRLALYKHAEMNFSVGGGSTNMLRFSTDIPYRTFKYVRTKFSGRSRVTAEVVTQDSLSRSYTQDKLKNENSVVISQKQLEDIKLQLQDGVPKKIKIPNSTGGYSVIVVGDPNDKRFMSAASLGSLTAAGFPPGSQFPWHTENQKIIWEEDTFESLKKEYDKWFQKYQKS